MQKIDYKEVEDLIINITVPECAPRPNSEYHLGFNDARVGYAEAKIRAIRQLKELFPKEITHQ